jgi:hypothetical protein
MAIQNSNLSDAGVSRIHRLLQRVFAWNCVVSVGAVFVFHAPTTKQNKTNNVSLAYRSGMPAMVNVSFNEQKGAWTSHEIMDNL